MFMNEAFHLMVRHQWKILPQLQEGRKKDKIWPPIKLSNIGDGIYTSFVDEMALRVTKLDFQFMLTPLEPLLPDTRDLQY